MILLAEESTNAYRKYTNMRLKRIQACPMLRCLHFFNRASSPLKRVRTEVGCAGNKTANIYKNMIM
jgi:hypothetical protein